MTSLQDHILARIAAEGPMRLSDYMATCLLHPSLGYYTTRPPFGAQGDFITAPEISQMFGELLGLCLAQSWLDQGSPAPFTLAELGPGRGTLMADVLRATRGVAGFHAAARIHLIEASPALMAAQRATLAGYNVTWGQDAAQLPDAPLFLLANEFFDALPIRQFHREADGWAEVMVGAAGGALVFGKSAPMQVPSLAHKLAGAKIGDVVEICPSASPIMAAIGARIAAHGGAALIVDYGAWDGFGDTFQAMRGHSYADPLCSAGLADLTAHVDFAALARAAMADASQPELRCTFATQGAFLAALGIGARSAALAARMTGNALQTHLAATARLTNAGQMGQVFKVLGMCPSAAPALAGFAEIPT
jgi:NADH dehydrogenase [ubiquinone] 1 alpha subcomplex assembly factor 7